MTDSKILEYIAKNFVAADFADDQVADRTVLKIGVPHGTQVSADLRGTVLRAMRLEKVMCGDDDRCMLDYGHDGPWHDDGVRCWPVNKGTPFGEREDKAE